MHLKDIKDIKLKIGFLVQKPLRTYLQSDEDQIPCL